MRLSLISPFALLIHPLNKQINFKKPEAHTTHNNSNDHDDDDNITKTLSKSKNVCILDYKLEKM